MIDTDTYTSYGDITDTWNSGLSYTNVNDATFGVQIKAKNTNTFMYSFACIDHIRIKIYYSIEEEEENPPTFDTIIESADPLELGETEIINVNVYDESTISNVYIEINSVNNSMYHVSGDNWRYSTWTPISVGIKIYQIHMIDEYNNVNQTDDLNITVQDTIEPIINNVIESADPLILGNVEIINCDVIDESEIYFVYLEFEGNNYSMVFISGINWRYSTWEPIEIGNYPYVIWANDTEGNVNNYNGDITVQEEEDIIGPTWSNLTVIIDFLELGYNITVKINVYDDSNVSFVYIEINGINYTMLNVSNIYFYYNWLPNKTGTLVYVIWMVDVYNNTSFLIESILIDNIPYIVLSFLILFNLIIFMLFFYFKISNKNKFLIVLLIFLFSLIIGVISITENILPFSPYLQIFFLLFQTSLFITPILKYKRKK